MSPTDIDRCAPAWHQIVFSLSLYYYHAVIKILTNMHCRLAHDSKILRCISSFFLTSLAVLASLMIFTGITSSCVTVAPTEYIFFTEYTSRPTWAKLANNIVYVYNELKKKFCVKNLIDFGYHITLWSCQMAGCIKRRINCQSNAKFDLLLRCVEADWFNFSDLDVRLVSDCNTRQAWIQSDNSDNEVGWKATRSYKAP